MGYLLEGALGALADGGEARVATDLIHGVKKNAPLWCEIGHCDHNDVLFMVVAFRGAEKSVIPLSERKLKLRLLQPYCLFRSFTSDVMHTYICTSLVHVQRYSCICVLIYYSSSADTDLAAD